MTTHQRPRTARLRHRACSLASAGLLLAACSILAESGEAGDEGEIDLEAECRDWGLPAQGPPFVPEEGEPATEARTSEWPRECIADELPARVTARAQDPDTVPSELELTFEGGILTSLDGKPCTFCDEPPTREGYVSLIACAQQYVCETIFSDTRTFGTIDVWLIEAYEYRDDQEPPQWTIRGTSFNGQKYFLGPTDVEWPACVPADCNQRECGSDFCGGSCGTCPESERCVNGTCIPPINPSTTTSSSGQSACDTCLDTCQGFPGCCTGTGCVCQDECRPSSTCAGGATYCCGPDGFCFCTTSCPYR